jgi:hypothetical protein
MALHVRRRTCGHGATDTEQGPAGRCDRCRAIAQILVRLRQAEAIARTIGVQLNPPSVEELNRAAIAAASSGPRPSESAPRPRGKSTPTVPAVPARVAKQEAPPSSERRPLAAFRRIGGDPRAWWDREW